MANTHSPIRDRSESPRRAYGSFHRRGDLNEGQVRCSVPPLDLGVVFLSVGQFHLDLVGLIHDVIVGEDVAVLGDDETGSQTPLIKITPQNVLDYPGSRDIDNRRAEPFHQIGDRRRRDGRIGLSGSQGRRWPHPGAMPDKPRRKETNPQTATPYRNVGKTDPSLLLYSYQIPPVIL